MDTMPKIEYFTDIYTKPSLMLLSNETTYITDYVMILAMNSNPPLLKWNP